MDLKLGDVVEKVSRGSTNGRVGIVLKFNAEKTKARVEWAGHSTTWINVTRLKLS